MTLHVRVWPKRLYAYTRPCGLTTQSLTDRPLVFFAVLIANPLTFIAGYLNSLAAMASVDIRLASLPTRFPCDRRMIKDCDIPRRSEALKCFNHPIVRILLPAQA